MVQSGSVSISQKKCPFTTIFHGIDLGSLKPPFSTSKTTIFLQVIVCFTRCLVKRRTGKSGTLKPWRLGSGASDGLMILSFTQGGAQKP